MSGESSAEVQKEAEAERAELVGTLDRLRENLKPANVVDEVMANAKLTTADITDRLWTTARANPIASVFIGLGAAMILGVGQQVRSRAIAKQSDATANKNVTANEGFSAGPRGTPDQSSLAGLKQQADATKARLTSQLQSVGSRAANSASQISDSAHALRNQASRAASSYASSARQGLDSLSGDSIMNQYSRSRDQISGSLSRLLEEQPLVLAALGVAVGAAIGAAIPSTEAESRLMGEASESFKTKAQELAQQEYAHLKETASSTLGDLKQVAAERGVSADNVTGLIQDAGAKVRDAAHDVASHAAEQSGIKA